MTQILHIIHELSGGGAARELLNVVRFLGHAKGYSHTIATLAPLNDQGRELAEQTGVEILEAPSSGELYAAMEHADIVQVEWWNASYITPFLLQPFPSCRLVIRYHVAGDKPPHVITPNHLKLADVNILSKAENPVLSEFEPGWKAGRVRCILHGSDFNRMPRIQPRPHNRFNVGYIGTVNFVKMHPDYVEMSNRIQIPDVRFVICGGVSEPVLLTQVQQLKAEHKFHFMGYVEQLENVIAEMDVFGYPLCPDTYASTELVLQEVMHAGIPPVVFPYGGVAQTVKHNVNGYIVQNAEEYINAIEFLFKHPKERKRLGAAARKYVTRHLGIENTVTQYQDLYERLMARPKMPHRWGIDVHSQPAETEAQPVSRSQGEVFIESLGVDVGRDFKTSLYGTQVDEVLSAESNIMHSRYVLAKNGVIRFRNLYAEDPLLNLWAGLCCEGLNDAQGAVVCYSTAISKGFTHWRVYWYLSRVLEQLGEQEKSQHLINQLQRSVDGFDHLVKLYSKDALKPELEVSLK